MTIHARTLASLLALVVLLPVTARALEPHVVARPIDPAGSFRKPDVAVHPGTRAALHLWQGRDAGAGVASLEIFATLVPTNPVPAAPTTVRRVSYMGSGSTANDPAVVALGDRFLAAWSGWQLGLDNANRIYLRTVSLAGVVTSDQLRVSTAALALDGQPANDSRPQLACSSIHASCLVVWARRRGQQQDHTEVHGRHYNLLTGTLGPEFQISRAGSAQVPTGRAARPQLAYASTLGSYVVAWTGYAGETGGGGHAYLAEVAPGSQLPGPARSVPVPVHGGRITSDLAIATRTADPTLALALGFAKPNAFRGLMVLRLQILGGLPVLQRHDIVVQGLVLADRPRLLQSADGTLVATWGEGVDATRIDRQRWWSSRQPDAVATVASASELGPDLRFVNGPAASIVDTERLWLAWAAETADVDSPQSRILGQVLDADRLFAAGFEDGATVQP